MRLGGLQASRADWGCQQTGWGSLKLAVGIPSLGKGGRHSQLLFLLRWGPPPAWGSLALEAMGCGAWPLSPPWVRDCRVGAGWLPRDRGRLV